MKEEIIKHPSLERMCQYAEECRRDYPYEVHDLIIFINENLFLKLIEEASELLKKPIPKVPFTLCGILVKWNRYCSYNEVFLSYKRSWDYEDEKVIKKGEIE